MSVHPYATRGLYHQYREWKITNLLWSNHLESSDTLNHVHIYPNSLDDVRTIADPRRLSEGFHALHMPTEANYISQNSELSSIAPEQHT